MKLFRLQTLKSLWTLKPPDRAFHGHARLLVSDVHSQYDSIRRGKQEIPKYFNFASDVLDKWSEIEKAGKRPPNPAFWWINGKGDEVKWSFEELGFLSRKVANVLTKVCGLQKGDRIITILPRIPEWWLVYVACMRTGIVLIPGTSQLSAKDILYRLQASKAMCIITSDTVAPAVDSVASECQFLKSKLIVSKGKREGWLNLTDLYKNQSADHSCVKTRIQDPMSIFFTSGSTGYPKMAEHSQGSLGFRPLLSERYWLNSSPSDIVWCTADTGWILAAVASLIDPWIFGSCIFVHMLPKVESAAILNTLCEFPIDTLVGAPTLFRMLVQNDLSSYKFMNLKHCMSGGEPLNPEVMEQWKSKTGLDIREVYGQTEAGLICCVFKGMKIKPGSMGKAVPIYDVQIIDKNANILPPGQQGEIAIRSKPLRPLGLFSQYVDNPKKTAESERGDFYVTGDRAIMDEDGYFQFIGRDDDIIISSGYRIGPFEVESALIEHPAVAETAVISSPDPLRGEVVKAFVVLSPTFSSSDLESLTCDLQEHVKKTTAPYKYPRKVIKDNGNILLPGEGGNLAIQIKPAKPFGLFPRYVVVKAFIVPSAEFTSHDPEKLVLQLQKHVKKSYCTLQIVHKARKVSLKIPLCCCHRLLDLYIGSVRLPSMLVPFCNDIKPELEQETNEETDGRSETFLFGVRAGVPALPHQTGLHATRGVGVCSTTTKDDLWENPKE